MSDTISPSVTFRVPRGRDTIRRHGGPRRSLPRGDSRRIVYHKRATVDAARRCHDPIHPTTKAVGFLRGFYKSLDG